jgi:hypothetical protein
MNMETVRLSSIAELFIPDVVPFLTPQELDMPIVLRNGMAVLAPEDALEIVEQSICYHQQQKILQ